MMPFIFAEPARINFCVGVGIFFIFFLHGGNGLCVLSEYLIGDERVWDSTVVCSIHAALI
jgi:hypothetical protein